MAETETPIKARWPKTPDGVTDWEAVFEDEDAGLIALVMKADTPTALGKSAYTLIQNLFTRKSDEGNAAELLSKLESIIIDADDTANLDVKKEQVAALLRGIKEERQRKAAAHIRRKARGNAIERRGRNEKLKRTILLASAFLVLVVFAGGLGAIVTAFFLGDDTAETVTADVTPTEPSQTLQSPPGADTVPTPAPAEGTNLSPDGDPVAEPEAPPEIKRYVLLNLVRWTFAPDGKKSRTVTYSPLIELTDMDNFPDICRFLPSILDVINETMSTTFDRNAQPDEIALANANAHAVKTLNAKLGNSVVSGFAFSREIEGRARINTRAPCRLYPPPEPVEDTKPSAE